MPAYPMDPALPSKMPHLEGALRLSGPRGMCFHRATAFVLDVPAAALCFGTFRAATEAEIERFGDIASREPFIHAWVQWRGQVYAPSTIERLGGLFPFDRMEYYRLNDMKDFRRLNRIDVLRLSRQHGFSAHLKKFKPLKGDAQFGAVLMDAAGIAWRLTDEGGVVPAGG